MSAGVVLVRSVLAAALVALLSSCILGSGFEPKDHCGFSGGSACATCMVAQCQKTIDACCNDSTCRTGRYGSGTLEILDTCGAGPATSCADKVKNETNTDAASQAVFACVKTTCRAECIGNARVPWSCETPRTSDTPCGTCIYASCGAALDSCCDDTSCGKTVSYYTPSDVLTDIDACVTGDAPGCAYLKRRSTSGKEGVVRACIEGKCAAECLGNGRPHQSCTLHDGGTWCSCSDAETTKGDECGTATVGGLCVVTRSGCECGPYTCETSSSGCTCSVGDGTGTKTSCSRSSGTCCLAFDSLGSFSCACKDYKSSCYASSGEVEVSSCDKSVVLAALQSSGRSVDKCSQ